MAVRRARRTYAASSRPRVAPRRAARRPTRIAKPGRSGNTLRIVIEQPRSGPSAAPRSLGDLAPVAMTAAKRAKF